MRPNRWVLGVVVMAAVALTGVGCGKKKDEAKAKPEANSPTAAPNADAAPDLAPINAAVPDELKSVLQFEMKDDPRGRLSVVAPKGWDAGVMPGSWKPPKGDDLGFMTRFAAFDQLRRRVRKERLAAGGRKGRVRPTDLGRRPGDG